MSDKIEKKISKFEFQKQQLESSISQESDADPQVVDDCSVSLHSRNVIFHFKK